MIRLISKTRSIFCPHCKSNTLINYDEDVYKCTKCKSLWSKEFVEFMAISDDVRYPLCPQCLSANVILEMDRRRYKCPSCEYTIFSRFNLSYSNYFRDKTR